MRISKHKLINLILNEVKKQVNIDTIKIKRYNVYAECDYNNSREEILETTDDYDEAYNEYKDYDTPLSERGDTYVFLQERIDTYELNKDKFDVAVKEYDYTIEDIYDSKIDFIDFDYFDLESEGEYKVLEDRIIDGSEVNSEQLEYDIWSHLKYKYKWSGKNYTHIKYKNKSITIRLKDHSARPTKLNNDMLSIVVRNDNKTDKWSRNNESNEIVVTGDMDMNDIEDMIKNKLDEITDRLDENISKLTKTISEIVQQSIHNESIHVSDIERAMYFYDRTWFGDELKKSFKNDVFNKKAFIKIFYDKIKNLNKLKVSIRQKFIIKYINDIGFDLGMKNYKKYTSGEIIEDTKFITNAIMYADKLYTIYLQHGFEYKN